MRVHVEGENSTEKLGRLRGDEAYCEISREI